MPADNPGEAFEIFDDDGRMIGLKERSIVHREGLWHRSVNVFLYRSDGLLLIQRRAESKDVCPGRWDLSCGEHLTPNETFTQAAKRGLWEELGIYVNETSFHALSSPQRYEYHDPQADVHDREIQQAFSVSSDSPVRLDTSEVAQSQWVTWQFLTDAVHTQPDAHTPWLVSTVNRLVSSNGSPLV